MPIHVREVHVKVTVNNSPGNTTGDSSSGEDNQKEAIVAESVEKVLQILKDKNER